MAIQRGNSSGDLLQITKERAIRRAKRFKKILEQHQLWINEEQFEARFGEEVARKQIVLQRRAVSKYRDASDNKRFSYQEDIDRAREGNEASLCRIIKWDKSWLYVPWVKDRILEASDSGRHSFLSKVGAAISGKSGQTKAIGSKKLRDEQFDEVLPFIEAAILCWIAERPHEDPERIKRTIANECMAALEDYWDQQPEEQIPPLARDRDYFRKYLKRSGVI